MFVFRSSSIRWIRFSSLISSAFELLYTNSILINKNVTRVKEVTEIAKGILLIFSVDFVRTFLFASISVLAIFKTAEEEYISLAGTDVAQKRKWRWNYSLSAELFKCTPYSLKYHLHSCQTIQIKFLKRRSLTECFLVQGWVWNRSERKMNNQMEEEKRLHTHWQYSHRRRQLIEFRWDRLLLEAKLIYH